MNKPMAALGGEGSETDSQDNVISVLGLGLAWMGLEISHLWKLGPCPTMCLKETASQICQRKVYQ